MGERLLCKQEVVGSIPSGSTNFLSTACERALLLPRAEIPRAAMPPACIFYIVKRGST